MPWHHGITLHGLLKASISLQCIELITGHILGRFCHPNTYEYLTLTSPGEVRKLFNLCILGKVERITVCSDQYLDFLLTYTAYSNIPCILKYIRLQTIRLSIVNSH